MLKWYARKQIGKFERRWKYDMDYMREIVADCSLAALGHLQAMQKIGSYRKNVPANVYYAAKIFASRAADCGPCAQLVISMAEDDGVSPELIRAVLTENPNALDPTSRLGYDFAKFAIAHDPAGENVRAAIVEQWGREGLLSLAYALVAAQAFPTFKYAIGHGHACARLRVGGHLIAAEPTVPA